MSGITATASHGIDGCAIRHRDLTPDARMAIELLAEEVGGDTRYADSVRAGLEGVELTAWLAFRAGVLIACKHKRRSWLADKLGVSEHTLEDWTSPSGANMPRLGACLTLLRLLAPADRARVVGLVMTCLDLAVTPVVEPSGRDLYVQVVELAGTLGRVGDRLLAAKQPDGDGGVEITVREELRIDRALDDLIDGALKARATLHDIART